MSWRLAKSLIKLKAQVDADYPGRPTKSDGARGDAAHASRASDHNEDSGGVVRALDLTEWVQNGIEMNDVLAEQLRASRDTRIKYVISDGRMFSSYKTSTCGAWQWRAYSGVNAHTQHVHISVVAGAHADDTHAWAVGRRLPERASRDRDQEDEMSPNEAAQLKQAATGVAELKQEVDGLRRDVREIGAALKLKVRDTTKLDGVIES